MKGKQVLLLLIFNGGFIYNFITARKEAAV
jgi:hypothetical protein